jgi:hypothetical protein
MSIPVLTPQLDERLRKVVTSLFDLKACMMEQLEGSKGIVKYIDMLKVDIMKYDTLLGTIKTVHDFEQKYPMQ